MTPEAKRLYAEYRNLSDAYIRLARRYAEYCDIPTFEARAKAAQYRTAMHRLRAFSRQALALLKAEVAQARQGGGMDSDGA